MKRKYNCVELFAGSGGLGTGFANSGFNIISANDCLLYTSPSPRD